MKELFIILALLLTTQAAHARDAKQVRLFRASVPCPATGQIQKSCPGWVVNHIVPLCLNGEDSVDNMEWEEKKASYKRDVFERKICREAKKTNCGM